MEESIRNIGLILKSISLLMNSKKEMETRSALSQSIRFSEPRIFLEVSLSQVFLEPWKPLWLNNPATDQGFISLSRSVHFWNKSRNESRQNAEQDFDSSSDLITAGARIGYFSFFWVNCFEMLDEWGMALT